MATNNVITLTPEGKQDLEGKLQYLKSVRRPQVAEKIGRAADDGDLSENGAYHDAKEEQGRLEGQIAELEYILRNSRLAEDTGELVGIGKQVVVQDETGQEKSYRIVSSHEVNPTLGYISDRSPIGAALVGARQGDRVTANTPGRARTFTIVSVE